MTTPLVNGLNGWEAIDSDSAVASSFVSCGLSAKLVAILKSELGAEPPTKMQELLVSGVLSGRDVVCGSAEGCGKTVGYVAAIVETLSTRRPRLTREDGTHVVVLCRDLQRCQEVGDIFKRLMSRVCWWLTCSVFAGALILMSRRRSGGCV